MLLSISKTCKHQNTLLKGWKLLVLFLNHLLIFVNPVFNENDQCTLFWMKISCWSNSFLFSHPIIPVFVARLQPAIAKAGNSVLHVAARSGQLEAHGTTCWRKFWHFNWRCVFLFFILIVYVFLFRGYSLQVQRFSKTRSFVKDQVLLDLFVRLKFSHLPTSLALTTCYNHLSPGKLGPWRFTVLSQ